MTTAAPPRPTITPLSVALMTAGYLFGGIALGMAIGFFNGMLFVPATLFVAAVSAWLIGEGLRFRTTMTRRLALSTGFAAAGAYLLVYLLMDFAGWQVGAPEASKRATMLVVTALASLAAALAGGAAIGTVIAPRSSDRSPLP